MTKKSIQADDIFDEAVAEAEADAATAVTEGLPEMPERFSSGGATAEEIAAWKAANWPIV